MDAKTKTINSFNLQAEIYDTSNYSKEARGVYPYVFETLYDIPYASLLDIGCGTGVVLEEMARIRPESSHYGLDISEKMLDQARLRLGNRAQLKLGDSENLPYTGGSMDVIVCTESFHHYPNPLRALQEMRRVLKKRGTLVLCDCWTVPIVRNVTNFFLQFSNGGDVHLYSEKEIRNLLEMACFYDIEWELVTKDSFRCVCR